MKTLAAIMKFPRLCDMYRRTNKIRLSKAEYRDHEQKALLTLRHQNFDDNQENTTQRIKAL